MEYTKDLSVQTARISVAAPQIDGDGKRNTA